jgi:DNA-binding XRE family transcriptional regulator
MKKNRSKAAVGIVEIEESKPEKEKKASSSSKIRNNVRKIRESLLISKAELARKSGLSALTIDRVESGYSCRMDTKRKIILALGMNLTEKDEVFLAEDSED